MRKKQTRGSVRFAVRAMERATHGLPSEQRDRYHDELVAEMHGLGRLAAWRYAVGVALSGHSMHAALTDGGPQPAPVAKPPLACRTNTHHVWKWYGADDGGRYMACARCRKEYISTGTAGMIGG
ncbi:hypothetical protein GCM10027053_07850 [Intrasporangium mesophilum]